MEDTVEDRISTTQNQNSAWLDMNTVTDPGSGSDRLLRYYLGINKKDPIDS